MKRVLCTVLALSASVVLVVAVSASGDQSPQAKHRGHGSHGGKAITVIEHASTDTTTDTGATGDSVGDVLTFANDVFDATNAHKVGTDQGYCLRVVAATSYECTWTTFLPGGQIVVAGPFYDAKDSTLAITGGTGRYRDARGTMELHARAGGTEFAFVFHVDD
jgi:Allene oxide cyclase barrel like domain